MEYEFKVKKIKDWQKVINWIIELPPQNKCFFLYGDMGIGKTTFVKTFCEYLKIKMPVNSPTFSIVNVYSDFEIGKKIFHLDLYRLKNLEEALDIGIEDYLYPDTYTYTFVEWPQMIENLAPPETVRIKMSLLPDSTRKIVILQ